MLRQERAAVKRQEERGAVRDAPSFISFLLQDEKCERFLSLQLAVERPV